MQDAASCYRMGMTEFAPNAIDIKKTSAQACEPANRKTKQNKQTTTKKKKKRKKKRKKKSRLVCFKLSVPKEINVPSHMNN